MGGKTRRDREQAIRKLVESERVDSQETLRRRLATIGFDVSQSTVSRDLDRLRLLKRPSADGRRYYAFPDDWAAHDARALHGLLPDLLVSVRSAGHLVVIQTLTGAAQPVAAALDRALWPEIVGTVAGDDTVLVVLAHSSQIPTVTDRLRSLAKSR